MRCRLCTGAVLVGLAAAWAGAAENAAEVTLVYPCTPAPGPVTIDGKLTPQEWAGAVAVSGFQVSGSDEMAPEQVVMRIMLGRELLYLGVKCLESRMKHVVATPIQRDGPFWLDDAIEWFIDGNHDHETFWQFAVTAGDGRYDSMDKDATWNCDWRSAVVKGADAWTVEAAIPLTAFGKQRPKVGTLWGFNLCRERRADMKKLELYNWANVERNFHTPSLFGHIRFVPAGWRATGASVVTAAQGADGARSTVYAPEGVWTVRKGPPPVEHTYRAELAALKAAGATRMAELDAIYARQPKMAMHQQYLKLEAAHKRVLALIKGTGPVEAEAYARAKSHLQTIGGRLDAIYWRVRVVMLNQSM